VKTKLDWRDLPSLDKFEKERNRHRRRNHRITYDCKFAHSVEHDRVVCIRGKILGALSLDGSVYLLFIIRGRTSFACKKCTWFAQND
jgi:hypothetical protein